MRQFPESILLLIRKYLNGTSTPDDKSRLDEWYHSFDDSEGELTVNETGNDPELSGRLRNRILDSIHQNDDRRATKKRRRWDAPAAAVILILISFGAYFMFLRNSPEQEIVRTVSSSHETKPKNDIKPGGNKAMLTLADGSVVVLDSASNGIISRQGDIKVQKLRNGLLAYTINGKNVTRNVESLFNTISTPRGGQYQVTLSDGTKVWLNAASSIRFPVVFTASERKVEITGEAYFEVAKNKERPFKVKAISSEIEVLGTHFNVNAYKDEATIKTTLLEGKVKVSVPNSVENAEFLLPGQQAGITKNGKINIKNHVDTEEAVAWMKGYFQFKSTDLKVILRQISRWYDVDVEYHGNINLHFTGLLTRNENVSKVFEKLALTGGVHFEIEGKRVIVSP